MCWRGLNLWKQQFSESQITFLNKRCHKELRTHLVVASACCGDHFVQQQKRKQVDQCEVLWNYAGQTLLFHCNINILYIFKLTKSFLYISLIRITTWYLCWNVVLTVQNCIFLCCFCESYIDWLLPQKFPLCGTIKDIIIIFQKWMAVQEF